MEAFITDLNIRGKNNYLCKKKMDKLKINIKQVVLMYDFWNCLIYHIAYCKNHNNIRDIEVIILDFFK